MAPSSRPYGFERATFELDGTRVEVLLDAGPRIVGYQRPGLPDVFADLPNESIEHPAIGAYWFIGGHRLWRAPEQPRVTYQPDGSPVAVEHDGDKIVLSGIPDSDGIVKMISIEQIGDSTVVDHSLRNTGPEPVHTAAWAITQLRCGGTAIVPLDPSPVDPDGVLPDRSLTLWPYTDLTDRDVVFGHRDVRVSARRDSAKWKIGLANEVGWIAYALDDAVFVKWPPLHDARVIYPHLGGSIECYRDNRFVELESLGGVRALDPGDEMTHREVWTMLAAPDDLDDLAALLEAGPIQRSDG